MSRQEVLRTLETRRLKEVEEGDSLREVTRGTHSKLLIFGE